MRMRKRCLLLLLALAAALTLSACAEAAVRTYTVTFDLNYEDAAGAPNAQTVTAGGKLVEPAAPERNGYTFGGWYKEAACENAWDFAVDTVSKNATLYAKWTEQAFTVSFDLNYESATGAPAAQTVTAGDKLVEPAAPERNGYAFGGWYKEVECENAWDFAVDTVSKNATLYAKWAEQAFTVTFDLNYKSATGAPEAQTVAAGAKLTEPETPERSGYAFDGWYKEAACENAWDFAVDTVSGNATLYAKWAEAAPETFEVAFDLNYEGAAAVPATSAAEGKLVRMPAVPARTGYQFLGWYRDAACENIWWFTKDRAASDMTLYAKWTVVLCDVSFTNITPNDYEIIRIQVPYGRPVPADKVPQTDAGGRPYLFMGWYVNGKPYDLSAPVTEEYLYISGQWKHPVRITFLTETGQVEVETQWGAAVDERLIPEAPPREHAAFTGWQDDDGTFYPVGQPIVITGENGYVRLSTQYQTDSYDVVFLSDGVEVARKKVEHYAYAGKVSVTPPTGKRLAGWYDAETGGTYFDPEYTPVTGPMTLYARFDSLAYQIIVPNIDGYSVMSDFVTVTHGGFYRFTVSGLQPGDAVLVNGVEVTGVPDAANPGLTAFTVENAVETQVISIFCAASQPQALIFYDSASNVLARYSGNPGTWVPAPEVPEIEGKEFAGWYDAPEGGNPLANVETIGASAGSAYARYRARRFDVQFSGMAHGLIVAAYGTCLNKEEVDALSWREPEPRFQYVFHVGESVLTYEELLALPIVNYLDVYVHSEFVLAEGTLTLVYEKDGGTLQKTLEVSNEIPLWHYLEREGNALTLYRWYADEARTQPVNIRETYLTSETLTLYGKPAEKVITVTFDAAGGTCPTQSVAYDRDSFDNDAPLPACARTGYVFLGWFTQEGQAVESWQYVYAYCLEDITLVANYMAAVDHTGEAIVGNFELDSNLFSFRADGSYIAWMDGRIYTGYYRPMDETGEMAWMIDGIGGIVRSFSDGVLHFEGRGNLRAIEDSFVVFDLNMRQTVLCVPKGGSIQSYPRENNGRPVAWYRDRYYSVAWEQGELVGESLALYGRVEVCVTFEANGGTLTGETKETFLERDFWDGGTLDNPAKEGFFFEGWYADTALTGTRIVSVNDLSALGKSRVTLYAKWLAPVDYTSEAIVGSFAGPLDSVVAGNGGGSVVSGYVTLAFLPNGTMTVTSAGRPVVTNYRKTGENAFTITYPVPMAFTYDAAKDSVTVAFGTGDTEYALTLPRIDTAGDAEAAQAFVGAYTGCMENNFIDLPGFERSENYYGVVRLELAAGGTGMFYLNGKEVSDIRWYVAGGALVVTLGELEAYADEADGVFTMTVFRREGETRGEMYFAFSREVA